MIGDPAARTPAVTAALDPADRYWLRVHQIAITGVGVALLGGTTFLGAVMQVGVSLCAICYGSDCNGGPQVCPSSVLLLAVMVAFLIAESLLVAVGLSKRAVARGTAHLGVYGFEKRIRVQRESTLNILAPFFAFFGWALLALGLMLPLNLFGFCHEPCEYPWVLSGYPLLLAMLGGVLLAAGAGLLGLIAVQRRRLRRYASTGGRE